MDNLDFKIGVIRPVECYKEAWAIIKNDYWVLFGISVVGILIGSFTLYILLGAMICGIFISFLKKIDTGTTSFDDLWKGFEFFAPSLVLMLIIVVPTLLLYAVVYAPFLIALVMQQNLSSDEFFLLLAGGILIDVILLVGLVCFHTLLMFAFPLIADRGLSVFQAIKLSMRAIWQNLGGMTGMIGIQFTASLLATFLTCGAGVYFIVPIMFGALAVAYRKIFPSLKTYNFAPPEPGSFR